MAVKVVEVNINKVTDVQEFCRKALQSEAKITMKSDTWRINGKSLLGLFSIDLGKPVTVEVEHADEKVVDAFIESVSGLVIEGA